MVLAHLALLMALQAPKAPPHKAPPALHNPLIIPRPEANLSAFRLDTEVFGWNKAYTEVGAVAMEMARSEDGAHRGESYLLVYPTTSTKPKHNVICHFITHVALPHNPVPLENAGDYMWTIEWSYQNMWPRRPKRRRPKGAMQVTPLWAPMPPSASKAPEEAAGQGGGPSHPQQDAAEHSSCVPWVGFRLQLGQEVRLHPYRPLDLSARCALLRLTDSRTYWGTPTVTASMVRFDFNASPVNEESARFVVSALWSEAKHVRFVVQAQAPLPAPQRSAWRRVLRPWGSATVRVGEPGAEGPRSRAPLRLTIRCREGWLPMAYALAHDMGYTNPTHVLQPGLGDTIVYALAPVAQTEADRAEAPPAQPQGELAGARPEEASPADADAVPAPATHQSPPAPARFLHDFKVP